MRDTGAVRREHLATESSGLQVGLTLVLAAVLTVTMFGWQGYHLYDRYQAASHKQTTMLVEAVYSAGERQDGLVEDLEHEVLVFGNPLTRPGVTEWTDYYSVASAETQAATAEALAGTGESLAGPFGLVDTTRLELDHQVEKVLEQLSAGQSEHTSAAERASTALLDPEYLAARVEFGRALDGLIAGLAAHLETQAAAERRDELRSVGIAVALFTAAIGAWAFFGRRLRRSQVQLAEEQEHRREAEAELLQVQKTEALGMMADGVAHDVKNLTAIISGSSSDVRKGLPDGHPVSAALTRIEEATRQADDMAKALLSFSRKEELPKGPVDLSALVVGLTSLLRYMVPTSIELVVEAPGATWIHGDPVRIEQTLLNLVANAHQAMPDGGTLTIAVRPAMFGDEEQPSWRLEVRDTGEGMTADVERRLFEPFFTTRPAGQGTGLGLSIVHRIIEDHQGLVGASSQPGEGSTFSIDLPAIPAPPPIIERLDRDGLAVLVADPDPYVRDLVAAALAVEGYRTESAATAGEIRASFARSGSKFELAVIGSRILVADRLSIPLEIPVILIGERVPTADLVGRQGVHTMGEPLSLAALIQTVVSTVRPSESLAPR